MTFQELIQRYLKAVRSRYSLSQISQISGLSRSEISRLSRGEREPKARTIEQLRKVDPVLFDKIFFNNENEEQK